MTLLVLAIAFAWTSALSQTDIQNASLLYREGKFEESIAALKVQLKADKKNPELWNLLGLNYMKTDAPKDARKAFKNAIKHAPGNVDYVGNLAIFYLSIGEHEDAEEEFDRVITIAPSANSYFYRGMARVGRGDYKNAIKDAEEAISLDSALAAAPILKMDATIRLFSMLEPEEIDPGELRRMLSSSRAALENCLKQCPEPESSEVRNRMRVLQSSERYLLARAGLEKYEPAQKEGLTELVVKSKPAPSYTDRARARGVSGSVVLMVEFRKDGKIGYIQILRSLPYGLTEEAIKAAKKIQFEPEQYGGEPQSVFKQVHFYFWIY
ncbi:MAG: TonB family protein [Aridibacter famidurans]|nr:TonB family protein [Aridibacter famidurans]